MEMLNSEVKFLAQIAAGFQPKDIITEEANNVGATWIIVDSSFARHLTFRMSGIECNISLVSDVEGAIVHDHLIANDESDSSMLMEVTHNPKSPKLMKGSTSEEEPSICHWPSTSRENVQEKICEPLKENETPGQVEPTGTTNVPFTNSSASVSEADFMVKKPKQQSWLPSV
ncbi:uncharacterized protein LOC111305042 isoform X2 [Durio zibethinus]|uniref:Uncharacterized protein LOC111305042 isoform X2 n=1 Tax=Durio zibethinus TaxID=66656 RepID=A0A6P5ZYW7_DURZI|nr:uncharacterized protein LOC111305042 isoform X2 [Durio zibethinus]